nr:hypothetical protein [Tanacetum cinerariifolium]
MILESVEHGPLIWPTIKENRVTRTTKYVELSVAEKIQADCNLKATNIILQDDTISLQHLPVFIQQSSVSTTVFTILVSSIWINSSHTISLNYLSIHTACNFLSDSIIDYGLAVPVFKEGDNFIDAINKMMSFLSIVITSYFLTTNNQLRNSSNPIQQATIHDGRVTVQPVQGRQSSYAADDLDAYDSDCDDFSTAKAVLMANFSSYGSYVLSEAPHFENTHNDMLNQTVHDTNSSAQQDAMILSMFKQLSNQVTNCNKVNKDNLIANESLSAELERYKEREKELLTKTFNVFKNESKKREAKNIDKEIALEKKVKELDNIVCKMDQSAQTKHMLTKLQVFYDNNLKQALGFQNLFYLKKAQQIRPMLYDGGIIAKETNMISIADSEETLMLEEESRSKMLLKQSDPKVLEKKDKIDQLIMLS